MKPSIQESDVQRSLLRRSPDMDLDNGCRGEGRKSWRRQARSAFTLIELLVVIAIIAVLAAMLLPVLSQAKSRAQVATELNNIHQIMLATHMYANDNNGILPQPGVMMEGPCWCGSCSFPLSPGGATATVGTYKSYYPLQVKSFHGLDSNGKALPRGQSCQFTPYLKNEKVLRCPADVPNSLMYQRQVYVTSYCWNQVVTGFQWNGGCGPPGWNGACGYFDLGTLKLQQFKAEDILLWENDELSVSAPLNQWNDTVSCPDRGISARHGKGGLVGDADGSSQWILLKDYYMMTANTPKKWTGDCGTGWTKGQHLPNRIWCDPLTADGGAHCP